MIMEGGSVPEPVGDQILQMERRAGDRVPQRIEREIQRSVAKPHAKEYLSNNAAADRPKLGRLDLMTPSYGDLHVGPVRSSFGENVGPQRAIVLKDAAVPAVGIHRVDDRADFIAATGAIHGLADSDV